MSIRLQDVKAGTVKYGPLVVRYDEFQYGPDGRRILVPDGSDGYRYMTVPRTVPIWAFARAR